MRYQFVTSSLPGIAVAAVITAASAVSYAGDSEWLLCKGTADVGAKPPLDRYYLVASLLEHRTEKGRGVSVTLIWGDRVSRGEMDEGDKATALVLRQVTAKQPVTFTGTGQLGQGDKTFSLTGTFDPNFGDLPKPAVKPFVAKLACDGLSNEVTQAPRPTADDPHLHRR